MTDDWKTRPAENLELAIAEFKAVLPGWWYSVCECQVSCDARIAPTVESRDIAIVHALPAGSPWDDGFATALDQPSSLAEALRHVTDMALAANAARSTAGVPSSRDSEMNASRELELLRSAINNIAKEIRASNGDHVGRIGALARLEACFEEYEAALIEAEPDPAP